MSDDKNNSGLTILLAVLALALVGACAYFFLAKNGEVPALPPVASTTPSEPPVVQGEVPPQPETPKNDIIVETRTLDLPQNASSGVPSAAAEIAPPVKSDASVEAMMADRSIGQASAPIKLTEYSSLTCSHCAAFHNTAFAEFKKQFIDTGRVQMTFKEFPLNPPALDASQILRCMPEDRFVSFMTLLFQQQENWAFKSDYRDTLRQNAKLAGMSDAQFDACLANTALKNRIVADMKEASDKYKVESTPSFVVNGGKKVIVGEQPLEFFKKSFDEVNSPTVPTPQ